MHELDDARMCDALRLAAQSIGLSDPNPRVGCVLGLADGTILGQGYTQQAGGAHAEVMALRDALSAGVNTVGATAWVTLEPCAHFGRTPPCCDALIAAGVKRVVVATVDPNPLVAGRGLRQLRDAGIEIEVASGAIADAACELNIGYLRRMARGLPWVRLKVAISLDGRTALPNGLSQWVTGEAARHDVHRWRKRSGAILTGIGTVISDDPRLDVRGVATARQPLRVVADSNWRTPANAKILTPPGEVLIVGAVTNTDRQQQLLAHGARTLVLPNGAQQVALPRLMDELARIEVNELHVEAGAKLNAALLRGGHIDEVLVYLAPRLLGEGAPLADLGRLQTLTDGIALRLLTVDRIGNDLRLRLATGASGSSGPTVDSLDN